MTFKAIFIPVLRFTHNDLSTTTNFHMNILKVLLKHAIKLFLNSILILKKLNVCEF